MRRPKGTKRQTRAQKPIRRSRPRKRKRTKRDIAWKQIFLFPVAIALLGGLVYLWFSGILRISYVEIQGNEMIDSNRISEIISHFEGDNVLMVRPADVSTEIKSAFAQVDSVFVTKQYFPNRLSIRIVEKVPFVIWHTGNTAYRLDQDGIIIGNADLENDELPLVYAFGASPRLAELRAQAEAEAAAELESEEDASTGEASDLENPPQNTPPIVLPELLGLGDKVSDRNYLLVVHDLYNQIPQYIGNRKVAYVESGEFDDLALLLDDGLEIRIKTSHTIGSTLERLETTLEEAKRVGKPLQEYVDLRFEKVYGK